MDLRNEHELANTRMKLQRLEALYVVAENETGSFSGARGGGGRARRLSSVTTAGHAINEAKLRAHGARVDDDAHGLSTPSGFTLADANQLVNTDHQGR